MGSNRYSLFILEEGLLLCSETPRAIQKATKAARALVRDELSYGQVCVLALCHQDLLSPGLQTGQRAFQAFFTFFVSFLLEVRVLTWALAPPNTLYSQVPIRTVSFRHKQVTQH